MQIIAFLILIVAALVGGKIATKLGLSNVVGQLIAGIVVGPAMLNWVPSLHSIHTFGELGVLLLMLNAGLETDVKQLKENMKPASLAAIFGVLLPLIVFPALALVFGINWKTAIFWGIVFAATSVSITLAVLNEQGKLTSTPGAVILGAAVLDDIIALLLVAVFTMFLGGSGLGLDSVMPLVAFAVGILMRRWAHSDKFLELSDTFGKWTLFPIFFGSIGLMISFDNFMNEILLLVILTVAAVATKYFGSVWGARLGGISAVDSRAVGAGMVSRGEMALVIVQIGLGANIINEMEFSSFVIVIILSTIIAPIMLRPLLNKVTD
ncbi:Kef-type K+ transport system membrane component KefB [Weissella uvarum]|uniref:cation:proton antiporter n=1 Tax=Weissella uvarum TaxID=1479233 RepID=UPI0019608160|nr:cation:proton antiporter [Weissella uvarum]MBM7617081.1 Kef-type K+ transport system membrane component KefB [Weissella uvarum]MCM0595379.1 cation:proton antiporter [Weissella uvarum]